MKRKMMYLMMISIVSCLITMGAAPAFSADKVIKWRMQTFAPAASPIFKNMQQFCDKVKVATNGRLEIKLFPPGSLYPDIKGLQNIKAGVVQIGHTGYPYFSSIIPEVNLMHNLYGLDRLEDYLDLWYNKGQREILQPIYHKHGVHRAASIAIGNEPIWSNKPIRSLEDFKGLKIRMAGAMAQFFSEVLGASSTQLSAGEIYTGLKLGVIEAAEFTGGSLDYALGIHEVTKYQIMPYYAGVGASEFLVNLKAYNELSDELREILDLTFLWAEIHISQSLLNDNEKAKAAMHAGGMEIVYLNPADQKKVRELAHQWWRKRFGSHSPEAMKLSDLYEAKMREVGIK